LKKGHPPAATEAAKKIELLVLDVDGVLTDGRITYTSAGDEIKSFNVRDGHAVKLARRSGLGVGIITGRESTIVRRRAEELGVRMVYQGALDKMESLKEIVMETGLGLEQIAYMGDDVVDIPVLKSVGLACAPADAAKEVLERSTFISDAKGGKGAVRELILFILEARGLLDSVMGRYYNHDPNE
jgi:3-deoxy-D-manno-octulosonate 8-phosphate phosphatase (KDO 8-P phosphatase)